jgi:hypothetical protein
MIIRLSEGLAHFGALFNPITLIDACQQLV